MKAFNDQDLVKCNDCKEEFRGRKVRTELKHGVWINSCPHCHKSDLKEIKDD